MANLGSLADGVQLHPSIYRQINSGRRRPRMTSSRVLPSNTARAGLCL
jgi:hypothetical protein